MAEETEFELKLNWSSVLRLSLYGFQLDTTSLAPKRYIDRTNTYLLVYT